MSIPFSITATLNLPGGPTLPNDPIPAAVSSNFDHDSEFRLVLSGSGTKNLDLGTVGSPGLKGLLIMVEASSTAAPIVVRANAAVTGVEIAPGGFLAMGSPVPVSGITALSIDYTSSVTVRIWALA